MTLFALTFAIAASARGRLSPVPTAVNGMVVIRLVPQASKARPTPSPQWPKGVAGGSRSSKLKANLCRSAASVVARTARLTNAQRLHMRVRNGAPSAVSSIKVAPTSAPVVRPAGNSVRSSASYNTATMPSRPACRSGPTLPRRRRSPCPVLRLTTRAVRLPRQQRPKFLPPPRCRTPTRFSMKPLPWWLPPAPARPTLSWSP
jgi:hypothetical protein